MKHILFLLLISISTSMVAQSGQAVLILKDSTQIKGYGEISGISSIVSVKFKNDTLKYKTYKSKDLIGVDILENDYYRKFRYKYIDGDKYPEIMEIVAIDNLSLYVRVYEGGVLSNSFLNEASFNTLPNQTVILDNGQEISLSQSRNIYIEIDIPRYSYYVGLGDSDQVEHLYTKGLPFAKSFKKSMKKYFKDCSALLEKVENKEFSKDNLIDVLEFYNQNCFKSNSN
ncbi:hypothetical protein HSX10_11205 [Winogradskyella undariae]|uniref:hypothetical protein n=1 Tax=Winogradskyella undariae TaxID=1285465 RepID=UPI00156B013B|nr:hypothetical protein [Winogradskyella undariae]NRR92135.1 hypothetical protein [Winogradskyella undariae]